MKRKNKAGLAGKAKRFTAAALAGCMLYCGGMQAHAATLKDVFDEHYYADMYPDLKEVFGYDREALWQHFMSYGVNEGRNMNGLIDIVKYREMYSDLDAAFGNNWNAYLNHYLTLGAKEGRETGTDFNALDYVGRYKDLQEVYGTDILALWNHYCTSGAAEGREARDESIVQAEEAAARAEEESSEAQDSSASGIHTERKELSNGGWIIYEYDGDRLIKYTSYNVEGNCTGWTIFEAGKTISYNADGSVSGWRETLERNAEGYVLKDIVYNGDGSPNRVTIYKGDANKTPVEQTYYNSDGTTTVYEYNDAGKQVKYTHYNEDKVMDRMSTTEYDDAGNRVKQTTYSYKNGELSSIYESNSDGSSKSTTYNEDGSYRVIVRDVSGNNTTTNYNADGTVKE